MGTDLEYLLDQLAVRNLVEIQQVADHVHARVIEVPDPGAPSRDFDQTLLRQSPKPLTDRAAMHPELLCQFPL